MTGDQDDVFKRLKALLPPWFGDTTPILDAVLYGVAYALSFAYSLWAYAKLQTRILWATDGWLDMIAADFFGTALQRKLGQSDASFRNRIIINMFRGRGTRPAMVRVLEDITGRTPVIFEPNRPLDTGALNSPQSGGYCGVARMGSMAVPYTAMITAYRPQATGVAAGGAFCSAPKVSALNTPLATSYTASLSMVNQSATDEDIYAAVEAVKPVGTVMWVSIQ
ncbi:hypothetical protein Herbaro_09495 [Herbaspirillum sp. WKF16]|uniref:hypothetical protein n=1 Tax=Herbaspirillum sp. WKF16 TaxID=3028312 RepID=UPI0023A9DC9E|nr:hypothetical protein [Herbaspirillum sp. WKF16]WDZ97994.1 hypothetical protein Herbaro_09495 [Herbaspirillum sp. WKF16]